MKRLRNFLIVTTILCSIISILNYIIFQINKDNILISIGIRNYKALLFVNFVIPILILIVLSYLILKNILDIRKIRISKYIENEKRKADPLYDEKEVLSKLASLKPNVDKNYIPYIDRIIEDINRAKDIQKDFNEIIEDNNQPIILNISKELTSVRVHVLEDAKSITRRLIISKDEETIKNKLEHNKKLLSDAENLVVEAISYIDIKTKSTENDLENLTKALKELITLI